MRYLRLVGVAILAVAAISGLAASSASAMKITYSGAGKFTVTSGEGVLETVKGVQVTCKGDNGNGQLGKSPATTAELTVSFTGCATLGKKCTSAGGAEGLIDTVKLLATFGDITAGTAGGALLKPASGTEFLVPVECGKGVEAIKFSVKGSVIGEFTTKLDTQTNLVKIVFKQTKGKQAVETFAGKGEKNTLVSIINGVEEVSGLGSEEDLLLIGGSGQLLT